MITGVGRETTRGIGWSNTSQFNALALSAPYMVTVRVTFSFTTNSARVTANGDEVCNIALTQRHGNARTRSITRVDGLHVLSHRMGVSKFCNPRLEGQTSFISEAVVDLPDDYYTLSNGGLASPFPPPAPPSAPLQTICTADFAGESRLGYGCTQTRFTDQQFCDLGWTVWSDPTDPSATCTSSSDPGCKLTNAQECATRCSSHLNNCIVQTRFCLSQEGFDFLFGNALWKPLYDAIGSPSEAGVEVTSTQLEQANAQFERFNRDTYESLQAWYDSGNSVIEPC